MLYPSLSLFKKELIEQGITDVGEIALSLHQQKLLQKKRKLYSIDKFTLNGSNSEGFIISPETGERKKCILWCLNHYTGLNSLGQKYGILKG